MKYSAIQEANNIEKYLKIYRLSKKTGPLWFIKKFPNLYFYIKVSLKYSYKTRTCFTLKMVKLKMTLTHNFGDIPMKLHTRKKKLQGSYKGG